MPESDYPPFGFHFLVTFNGLGLGDKSRDSFFQSVTGLSVEVQTESIREGGENRFEHVLPLRSKYSTLTLKRGVFKDSGLITWSMDAFQNMIYKPVDLIVSLLNEQHEPLMSWIVIHAWPKKWSVSDFNAEQSTLVIETMELNYNFFQFKK